MVKNPNITLDLEDSGLRGAVKSEDETYVRQAIRDKIRNTEIVACLIGNGTAWRDWVDWELGVACQLRKGICGIMLKGSRGRRPPLLKQIGAPIASWNIDEMTAAIEQAAARRT